MVGGRHIEAALTNPDVVKPGEAFGARTARVEAEEVATAVRHAQATGGLWLLEIPFAPPGSVEMVPWMPKAHGRRPLPRLHGTLGAGRSASPGDEQT